MKIKAKKCYHSIAITGHAELNACKKCTQIAATAYKVHVDAIVSDQIISVFIFDILNHNYSIFSDLIISHVLSGLL